MPVPLAFLASLAISSCTATPQPVPAKTECTDRSCPMRTVQISTADEADQEKVVYVVVGAAERVVEEIGVAGAAGSSEVEWIEREELLP